jgi:hypothetical protein
LGQYWLALEACAAGDVPGTSAKWQRYDRQESWFNNKAPVQAVVLDGTGSTGIQIADHADFDFGTNNFAVVCTVSLPVWPPVATAYLFYKQPSGAPGNYNGLAITISSGGVLGISLYAGDNGTGYDSTVAIGAQATDTMKKLAVSVNRETALSAGSIIFAVDGVQLGASVPIAMGAPGTLSGTNPVHLMGDNTSQVIGSISESIVYNRALTVAQMLDLFGKGVAEADKYGSATEKIPAQTDRDFSGANNWINGNFNSFDASGDLSIAASVGGQFCRLQPAFVPMVQGKRYRLSFDVANPVSTFFLLDDNQTAYLSDSTSLITFSAGRYTSEFTYLGTAGGGITFYAGSATSAGDFDNFTLIEVGVVAHYQPGGIQVAQCQWFDAANKHHAMLPEVGGSLKLWKSEHEFRHTFSWSSSAATQFFGGVDQHCFTSKTALLDISCRLVAGSGTNITIGDEADADRYVTSTGVGAPVRQTLAAYFPDGTNFKFTVTPIAPATMTVEIVVRAFLLES